MSNNLMKNISENSLPIPPGYAKILSKMEKQ